MRDHNSNITESLGWGGILAAVVFLSWGLLTQFDPIWSPLFYAIVWGLAVLTIRHIKPLRWALVTPVRLTLKALWWPFEKFIAYRRRERLEELFRVSHVSDKDLRKYLEKVARHYWRLEERVELIRDRQERLITILEAEAPLETRDDVKRYQAASTPGVLYDPAVAVAVANADRPLENAAHPDSLIGGPERFPFHLSSDDFEEDQKDIKLQLRRRGRHPSLLDTGARVSEIRRLLRRINAFGRRLNSRAETILKQAAEMDVPQSRQEFHQTWTDGVKLLAEAGSEFQKGVRYITNRANSTGPMPTLDDLSHFVHPTGLLAQGEAKLEEAAVDQRDWSGHT